MAIVNILGVLYATMTAGFWLAVTVAGYFLAKGVFAVFLSTRPGVETKARQ
jgi:hypothetical protein